MCIATYNGAKYIKEQIGSILPQLGLEDEIVISDDSSTDNTLAIIESLNDPRVKIYPNQLFKNPIYNFENAIKLAHNELIFLSDQDDLWLDGRVNAMKAALETSDMVVCDHSVIDENNQVTLASYFKEIPSGPGLVRNLKKNTYYGCCMAFRKKILKKAIPFPKDIPMHDIWLGFVGDLFYKTKFIDYPYTLYRKHESNVSNASDLVSNYSLVKKIKFRINILKYIPSLLMR